MLLIDVWGRIGEVKGSKLVIDNKHKLKHRLQ